MSEPKPEGWSRRRFWEEKRRCRTALEYGAERRCRRRAGRRRREAVLGGWRWRRWRGRLPLGNKAGGSVFNGDRMGRWACEGREATWAKYAIGRSASSPLPRRSGVPLSVSAPVQREGRLRQLRLSRVKEKTAGSSGRNERDSSAKADQVSWCAVLRTPIIMTSSFYTT